LTDLKHIGERQFLRVKSIDPVPKREPSLGPRRLVLLQLCNLEYARIGPVVVSVDSSAKDEGKVGLISGTKINVLNPDRGRDSDRTLSEETVPLGPTNPENDFAFLEIALDTLMPGKLERRNREASTSRTLVIRAENKGQTVQIECGYCTPLVTVLPNNRPIGDKKSDIKKKDAYELLPGEGVMVAPANASKAIPWRVTSVSPRFYPTTRLFEPVSPVRGTWFRETLAETEVLLAENMAVLLKVPGVAKPDMPKMYLPGTDGQGNAAGASSERVEDGKHSQHPQRAGFVPRIFAPDEDDPIKITENAKKTLLNRGNDILLRYEEEKPRIAQGGPDQGRMALLRKLLPGFSLPENPEERCMTIEKYVRTLIENREFFINDNLYSCRLPPLLFQEIVTAVLLQEYGATNTAQAICQDMIELAVFAGCEIDKEKQRIRLSPDYGLPLILRVPYWIKGESGDQILDVAKFPLGRDALRRISEWSKDINRMDVVFRDEETQTPQEANLAGLLSYFVELGGGSDPYFMPLRPPGNDGTLEDKDFQEWLDQQSKTIQKTMQERAAADRKRQEMEFQRRGTGDVKGQVAL
jgi:hypothetical protein